MGQFHDHGGLDDLVRDLTRHFRGEQREQGPHPFAAGVEQVPGRDVRDPVRGVH